MIRKVASVCGLAMFSVATYARNFAHIKGAISRVFDKYEAEWFNHINIANNYGPLNVGIDGAYDSPGFSAMHCRVTFIDTNTKLVLLTEMVERSECGKWLLDSLISIFLDNKSSQKEIAGFHRGMNKLLDAGIKISSITTDRCRAYESAVEKINQKRKLEGDNKIKAFFDVWHMAQTIGRDLRAVSRFSHHTIHL